MDLGTAHKALDISAVGHCRRKASQSRVETAIAEVVGDGNKYDKNRNVKPQEPDAMTCHFAKSATIFREFRNRVAKDSKYISMRKNWRQLEEA